METAAPSSSLSSFAPVHLINFCVVHTNLSFQSRPAILHLHPSCPQDFPVPPLTGGTGVISLPCSLSRSKPVSHLHSVMEKHLDDLSLYSLQDIGWLSSLHSAPVTSHFGSPLMIPVVQAGALCGLVGTLTIFVLWSKVINLAWVCLHLSHPSLAPCVSCQTCKFSCLLSANPRSSTVIHFTQLRGQHTPPEVLVKWSNSFGNTLLSHLYDVRLGGICVQPFLLLSESNIHIHCMSWLASRGVREEPEFKLLPLHVSCEQLWMTSRRDCTS